VDQFYCPLVDHFNWPLTQAGIKKKNN